MDTVDWTAFTSWCLIIAAVLGIGFFTARAADKKVAACEAHQGMVSIRSVGSIDLVCVPGFKL